MSTAVDSFTLGIARSISEDTSGTTKYQISVSASVTANALASATRLDQNVFVRLVSDNSFKRVASLSDMGLLKPDSASAQIQGHEEYRDSVVIVSFDDADTAIAAIPVIRDRVNALVKDTIQATTTFKGVTTYPASFNLPLADTEASIIEKYSVAYTDAVAARKLAESIQTAYQTAYDNLTVKYELLKKYEKTVCDWSTRLNASVGFSSSKLKTLITSYYIGSGSYNLNLSSTSLTQAMSKLSNSASFTTDLGNAIGLVTNAISDIEGALLTENSSWATTKAFLDSAKDTYLAPAKVSFMELLAASGDITQGVALVTTARDAVDGIAKEKWATDIGEVYTEAHTIASEVLAECTGRTAELAVLKTTQDSANTDLKNGQEAKAAALTSETSALSSLSNYCPDVDPTSLL